MFGKIRRGKTAENAIASGQPKPVIGDGPSHQETTSHDLTDARKTIISAEQADKVIIDTERLMALPIENLSFADGKIDTCRAQDWLDKATGLIAVSKEVFARGNYSQAIAYAEAARAMAEMADMLVAQALGTEKLPAHARPRGSEQKSEDSAYPLSSKETSSREQVRNQLLQTYDEIVLRDSLPAFMDVRPYLTEAMTAYKVAYDAYIDGSYQAASDENRLARGMLHVADRLIEATTTTA